MNFLPKPPTDNLYKFMAISGIWMMGFVIAFIMYLGYLNYQIEKEGIKQNSFYRTEALSIQIDDRLASISEGNLNDNIIDWALINDGSKEEISFLNNLKKAQEKKIQEYKADPVNDEYGKQIHLAEATGLMWVIYTLIFLSVLCLWLGFRFWYTHVQKPANTLISKDIEIRNLTIEKMKLDIDITRLSKNAHRKTWAGRR